MRIAIRSKDVKTMEVSLIFFFTTQKPIIIRLIRNLSRIARNILISIIDTKIQMEGVIGLIISLALVEQQKETRTMK